MADVKNVRKDGEYYEVKGRHNGRDVSVHIPSPTVESLSRGEAEKLFKRSVERIAETERG